MMMLGPIGFTAPWLLVGLLALPVLWILLRVVPPAPIRRRFPGVALLLGLRDEDHETDCTPWWLLLIRMLAIAALILGFAGPVLNPEVREPGSGPLLIVADGSWADARDWPRRKERITAVLQEAGRNGRAAALTAVTQDARDLGFRSARDVASGLPGFVPAPWEPDAAAYSALAQALPEGAFDTFWLSDGLARDGRETLLQALRGRGNVTVFESPREVFALQPTAYGDGKVTLGVLRAHSGGEATVEVVGLGLDPAGVERELARLEVAFGTGEAAAKAVFDLPAELRNRIARFEILGQRTAGAVALTDDAIRRREVALVEGGAGREGLELLSPGHYLRQALAPTADVIEGTVEDMIRADPDVIILADVAKVAASERLAEWIEKGGLLVRFAGPHMAAADWTASDEPLLPVQLRSGGRSVGGALSWGEPKTLAPFPQGSPFAGLDIPDEVRVSSQVIAEPGPELAARTIAALADGTPLVTRKALGQGSVVMFHVTANAEWSGLPLSGLFVQMLERLAVSTRQSAPGAEDMKGTVWSVERVLDAFGALEDAGDRPGIPGEDLAGARSSARILPGLYASGDRTVAVNAVGPDRALAPATWPEDVTVEGLSDARELPLSGWLLAAGLGLLFADVLAALALSGRLIGGRAGAAAILVAGLLLHAHPSRAEMSDEQLVDAAGNVVLAYVRTGDAEVDRVSEAGLRGLSDVLFYRTAVEPSAPMGVDVETDELSVFTLLYWPVTAAEPTPSPTAYLRLNRYLRSGGMILFDTRDADVAGFGTATPEGRRLQALAAPLDIPPLEPIPSDHVLTRAFYLLQDFPGRHAGPPVWVEAAPPDAELAEGMPFRNLNDGVTPVIIGGNDWASAWAVDDGGWPMLPVGRGLSGERQREIAYRFGVNVVMHVLTGNYKSDQVHVPALLERLGQ
ncbi:DUF4159 domain-containing protein [Defluviimonas sp. WL0002]|uniref:DUF4159 domain-containing protein n=1 Tax=Albidovulum marisflavi TaxID=2984159 RepID=A0ABT2ZDZ8_9RHOB|nr:DUF4159 domain-containing protein [Defluviimonas sp. WL0002]MCV2869368.1 DUF4159 domain-containing protein [Defluviimonas sp. WL0002]